MAPNDSAKNTTTACEAIFSPFNRNKRNLQKFTVKIINSTVQNFVLYAVT